MDVRMIWIIILIMTTMIICFTRGKIITSKLGANKDIRWTLDILPPPSEHVTVLHPSGKVLFSALGDWIIDGGTNISQRVTNKNNTNTITGNIEFTLNDVKEEDAGDFKALYTVGWSYKHAVGVTLIVYVTPSKPIITVEQTPIVDNTMVLNCSVMSNSKPDNHNLQMTYRWYIDGADLPSENRFNASRPELLVQNIQKSDNRAVFTCNAYEESSLISPISEDYVVQVHYEPGDILPNITQHVIFLENTDALGPITCSADCVPDCTYQWKFNSSDMGSPGETLNINNIQRASAGTYQCTAYNVYGKEQSEDVTVTVEYGPGVVSPNLDKNYSLTENTDSLGPIQCNAVCLPPCSYEWKFNGEDVGRPGDTLRVDNVQCRSTGTYWCIASNIHGTRRSNSVILTVPCSPRHEMKNENETHTILLHTGDVLNITSVIISYPPASLYWSFGYRRYADKYNLINNTNEFHFLNNQGAVLVQSTAIRQTMKKEYFGEYMLSAINPHGMVSITFNVALISNGDLDDSEPPASELQDCDSKKNQTIFIAGLAMISLGLIFICLAALMTGLLICRKRSQQDSKSANQHYEDIGTNVPRKSENRKVSGRQETVTKTDIYQDLAKTDVPSVYEKLETRGVQGGTDKQYMNTSAM